MKRSLVALGLLLMLSGCVRRSPPATVAPPDTPDRLLCDRFAARAIQAPNAADAHALAAQAAECYATIRVANGDRALKFQRDQTPFVFAHLIPASIR